MSRIRGVILSPYMLLLLVLMGGVLRALRLTWQPLWWDEGYSVYFATEPLLTMLRLTAQDIHPPLYYGLLRGWLLIWGDASPLALRSFSLAVGVLTIPAFWWMARTLFPTRGRLVLLATLLLVLNPMHIFYSQEVRMYGLEMLLGILSTGFFWRMMVDGGQQTADGRPRTADDATRNTQHAIRNSQFAIPKSATSSPPRRCSTPSTMQYYCHWPTSSGRSGVSAGIGLRCGG